MNNQDPEELRGDEFVQQQIAAVSSSMLPSTSAPVYRTAWHDLQDFRTSHGLTGPTTPRHLFAFLAKKHADKEWLSPGTLWTKYSMLKTVMRIREGTIVEDGSTLACEAWLKGLSRSHNPKQSLQLTKEQVASFLIKEGDSAPIDMRVLLIFGVHLGLRTADLKKIKWSNVSQTASGLRVIVDWATKTDQGARGNWYFIARENNPLVCGVALFAEYRRIVKEADPARLNGDLWLKVVKTKNGKWMVVSERGRNWISSVPSTVAKSLGLPNPEQYTGHCFRRTSAQWQADAGATVLELQNQFGWKNSSMASVYTGQSVAARSASSRRCLLSSDIAGNERGSGSWHQEHLQQQREQQERVTADTNIGKPQMVAPTVDSIAQWPVNINGQTINIYFNGPPPTGPAPQTSSEPITPLPVPQSNEHSNCQEGQKEVIENEKEALSEVSDSFFLLSEESESSSPIIKTQCEDSQAPMLQKEIEVATAKKTKKSKKQATKKQTASKSKAKAKSIVKKQAVTSTSMVHVSSSAQETAPNEQISSARPTRVKKLVIHSDPYSRNTKGYVPPQ